MQLTRGADESKAKTNGLAEFIAQEEMDRFSGFWWSDDSSSLAYCGVDESSIPPYPITHQALDTQATHTSALEVHRYPFAGEKNARVRLYVLNLGGREGGGEGGLEGQWRRRSRGEEGGEGGREEGRVSGPVKVSMSRGGGGRGKREDSSGSSSSSSSSSSGGGNSRRRRRRREEEEEEEEVVEEGGREGGREKGEGEVEEEEEEEELYVARVNWLPDGHLGVQVGR